MRYTVLYLKSLDGFKIVAVSLAAMLDTVKHGYGKHAYNDFLSPWLYDMLMNITNYT